jgi:hypothetical protein
LEQKQELGARGNQTMWNTQHPTPNLEQSEKLKSSYRALLSAHEAQEFGANLVNSAFVGLALLMEDGGDLGAGFKARLGLLLNLNIDHLFQ